MDGALMAILNLSRKISKISTMTILRPKEMTKLSKAVRIFDFLKIAKSKKYPGINKVIATAK